MFFKRDALKTLIVDEEKNQQRLTELEKKLAAFLPEWSRLQTEAETLESRADAVSGTYGRGVCEEFWAGRSAQIKSALEGVVAKRDLLTESTCVEILKLKHQIFRRRSTLVGAFMSWAETAKGKTEDSGLKIGLMAARKSCEGTQSIGEAVEIITLWANRIEAEESLVLPNFRLGDAIHAASEAGRPTA